MENGPFIDGLPNNSMVIFHGELLNNQMVITYLSSFAPLKWHFSWTPQALLCVEELGAAKP